MLLLCLSTAACGTSLDLQAIADLANPQTTPVPTPTATVTTLPSLRTLLPADMTATANANLIEPAVVHTATPNPNATAQVASAVDPTATLVPTQGSEDGTASAEIPATATPLATATPPPAPPELTLRTPLPGSQFIAGTGIDVSGNAINIVPGQFIRVALVNAQGGQLADATLIAADDWRVILPAPADITGPLKVEASIIAADGTTLSRSETSIEGIGNITVSEIPENDYFMAIDRVSSQAVAGKGVFLNGRSGSPLDIYDVTIELYYQDCTTSGGPISFQMYGSGGWNGYLIVPNGTQGTTVCLRAYTGTPGTDTYRQAEERFVVIDPTDPAAIRIEIATPRPGSYYTTPFEISGVAIDPPLGYVLVQIITGDGTVIWEQTVVPDRFGNWRTEADVRVSAPTEVSIAAIVDNTDGTFATDAHSINIQPSNSGN